MQTFGFSSSPPSPRGRAAQRKIMFPLTPLWCVESSTAFCPCPHKYINTYIHFFIFFLNNPTSGVPSLTLWPDKVFIVCCFFPPFTWLIGMWWVTAAAANDSQSQHLWLFWYFAISTTGTLFKKKKNYTRNMNHLAGKKEKGTRTITLLLSRMNTLEAIFQK